MRLDRKTAIVDIDGTLANIDHRLHHIQGVHDVKTADESKKVDWDAFHSECHLDEPILPTCAVVRELADADWCIILVTGRGSGNREVTEKWLERYDVPYNLLLMRKEGDHSPDVEVKAAWLEMIRNGQLSVPGMNYPCLAIEDRARVVKLWRELGIVTFQCDEGDF